MEKKIVLLDTSILIDYYRKTDKEKSVWISLVKKQYAFAVSSITKFEIYCGATLNQLAFWDGIFQQVLIVPLDESCIDTSVKIDQYLKKKRKQIEIADLFIAATAVTYDYKLATLNKKHFERIEELNLIN